MARLLLTTLLLLAGSSLAQAEITITRAEYANGIPVVRGETSQPDQQVVLDGRYTTRTDRYNQFHFRIRYLPPDCILSILAGQDVRPASVTNCGVRPGIEPLVIDRSPEQRQVGPQMRVVRQTCPKQHECRAVCEPGLFAVNAFCPGGEAKLSDERSVSCVPSTGGEMVAYCLAPANN